MREAPLGRVEPWRRGGSNESYDRETRDSTAPNLPYPGGNPRFSEKASQSDADIVFFDLEDAVAPGEKKSARRRVIEALNTVDQKERTVSIRINGFDTPYKYRDVVDVVEQTGNLSIR